MGNKIALSLATASAVVLFMAGCGGGSSSTTAATGFDVKVVDGPVYGATVYDVNGLEATQITGTNTYRFATTPVYPLFSIGGQSDFTGDKVGDADVPTILISCSTNITPLTTQIHSQNGGSCTGFTTAAETFATTYGLTSAQVLADTFSGNAAILNLAALRALTNNTTLATELAFVTTIASSFDPSNANFSNQLEAELNANHTLATDFNEEFEIARFAIPYISSTQIAQASQIAIFNNITQDGWEQLASGQYASYDMFRGASSDLSCGANANCSATNVGASYPSADIAFVYNANNSNESNSNESEVIENNLSSAPLYNKTMTVIADGEETITIVFNTNGTIVDTNSEGTIGGTWTYTTPYTYTLSYSDGGVTTLTVPSLSQGASGTYSDAVEGSGTFVIQSVSSL